MDWFLSRLIEGPQYLKYMGIAWVIYTAICVIACTIAFFLVKPVKSEAQTPPQQVKEQKPTVVKSIPGQLKPSEKGAKPMADDKPNISAPGGNVFYGTNTGTVNQTTVNELPEPKFSLQLVHKNRQIGDMFETVYNLEIDAKAPIGQVSIKAWAPHIKGFKILRAGAHMSGSAGVRDGFAFNTIYNVSGTCSLIVLTSEPEEVDFQLSQK